ncbi:MAG: decaprenyl-phosphate phosphoribosyltransferase [Actinobacteria bacterium]|nr:decaprenyl-phosphate phosphoribosyltransferase [Actinomycetota bacterium]
MSLAEQLVVDPCASPLIRVRSPGRAALAALRPRQWSKNLLLFAGLIFAAKLGDVERWLEASTAFVAYCAASSAAYLVNDVLDAESDRGHPMKRHRPIASGQLAPGTALLLAGVLTSGALALAALLGFWSLLTMSGFAALQGAYSLRLKHVVLVDVVAIAALFVLRATAGAEAVDVPISPWLLVCTALLALFLALAKRRAELLFGGAEGARGRRVLAAYSLGLVDGLVLTVAGSTALAYSLYAFGARDSKAMVATIPLVCFGICRYLLLVRRKDLGEEPENVLLSDRPILLTVAAWVTLAATILVVT